MISLAKEKKIKKKKGEKSKKLKKRPLANDSHYKYKIEKMMKFDLKKVHVESANGGNNRYYLLVKVQLFRSFAFSPMFDNFELQYFLNETAKSLLYIVPFTFKSMLLDGMEVDIEKENFFAKLEVLGG